MLKSNSFDVPRHTAMKRLDPKVGLLAASAAALAALLMRRRRRPAPVLGSLAGKVVVVTGASRGLGLEFARALLARGAVVYATCRDPARADALRALARASDGLVVRELDTSRPETAEALAAELPRVDLLVNNAGVASKRHPVDPAVDCDVAELMRVVETNVGGTCATTKAFLGPLRAGTKVVVTISSDLGSIAKTFSAQSAKVVAGGVCSYRISKAALNMAVRVFAAELAAEGFLFVALSPGWVATDMGSAGGRSAPLTPAESVASCLDVVQGLARSDNGAFLGYAGKSLPW